MRLRIMLLSCLLLVFTGCWTDDPTRHNTFVPITSMEVTGAYETMAEKTVNQYRAVGDFSGDFTRDITTEVTWIIEDDTIASVSNATGSEGLVTALSPGETLITAMYGDFFQSSPVIVTSAFLTGIGITPEDAELPAGITQQYEADGIFSDDSVQDITTLATWKSSDTDVATIDKAGLVTTLDPGPDNDFAGSRVVGITTISAAWQGIEASTSLLVTGAVMTSITLIPEDGAIAQGTTVQFEAEGTYSDGSTLDITDLVDWQSSDNGTVLLDANGLAEGIAPGEAEISASFDVGGDTLSATAVLTVTNAILESIIVTPENSTIQVGENQQYIATGTFSDGSEQDITYVATWLSSDNTVGTISNSSISRGLFISTGAGTTFIEAFFNGIADETLLTVQ